MNMLSYRFSHEATGKISDILINSEKNFIKKIGWRGEKITGQKV